MLEVEKLTKYYGKKLAISDVSFEVKKGEILGLLGPNAAGKTTTMRIITGFMPPDRGKVTVDGLEVQSHLREVRRKIGYLPENVSLYLELRTSAYLFFMAEIKGIPKRKRKSAVEEALEKSKTTEVRNQIIGRLSRGYRQRVGLAQALIHNPEVLILDEPTLGLDPRQIIETRELIKSLGGSHTIILSTHILPEVSMVCGRVVIIDEGKVSAEGTPEALTQRLRSYSKISLGVRGPVEEILLEIKQIDGVVNAEVESASEERTQIIVELQKEKDVREQIARRIVEKGFGLLEIKPQEMSLEEIFLKLTTKEETI
jgi:ABC-2 type transport system ATP-binding protein